MRVWAALPALAVALFASTSHAQDQQEVELRYPPSSIRPKLIFGGLAVGGLAYAGGFITQSQWPEVPGSTELKYPVVGPWMSLAKIGCSASSYADYGDPRVNKAGSGKATTPGVQVTAADCSGVLLFFRGFLTVLDGLAQLGGLGMIGEGIFMTTEAETPKKGPSLGLTIQPNPVITPTMAGLGFTGTF